MVKNWWRLLAEEETSIVQRFVRNYCSNDTEQPRKPVVNKKEWIYNKYLYTKVESILLIIYNRNIIYFCYFVDCILLTSGTILIDWHTIKSKDMPTRIVPRFASRCCLSVISSLFVKFKDFFEFCRLGGGAWFSLSAKTPFDFSSSKGWFNWDGSPW